VAWSSLAAVVAASALAAGAFACSREGDWTRGLNAAAGHTLFLGEIVDAGFQKPEDTPVLRMEDTRMSYGG